MPDLTAVLTIDEKRQRGEAALASILAQAGAQGMEVLLVDHGAERFPALQGSEDARVRVLHPGPLRTYGASLAFAIEHAQAPIVAFLEEHALACPGWAVALLEAHAQGWAGVGCQIRPALVENRISMGMSLINDPDWLAPATARPAAHLRGHNASYKIEILRSMGSELRDLLEFEDYLQRRIRERGGGLYIEPRATVIHLNDTTWRSMLYVYFFLNRALAPARAKQEEWSLPSRVMRAVLIPLIAAGRTVRSIRYARDRTRLDWSGVLAHGHVVLAAQTAASLGQSAGLILGEGSSLTRFAHHELNADRELPPEAVSLC